MDLRIVNEVSARTALSAIRGAASLAHHLLLDLHVVVAQAGQMPPQMVLRSLLQEIVETNLSAARGQAREALCALRTPGQELEALRQDWQSGDRTRQQWGVLYHHNFSAACLPLKRMVAELGIPERTVGRRIAEARRKLALQLCEAEARSLKGPPPRPRQIGRRF
jgi:hypothetical protein